MTPDKLRDHAKLLRCRLSFLQGDDTGSVKMERDALTAAADLLDREAFRLETLHTHSPECWKLGPRHYECAVREIERLNIENYEWQQSFDLYDAAVMRGTQKWRDGHPDRKHILPDTASMVSWLCDEIDAIQRGGSRTETVEQLERVLIDMLPQSVREACHINYELDIRMVVARLGGRIEELEQVVLDRDEALRQWNEADDNGYVEMRERTTKLENDIIRVADAEHAQAERAVELEKENRGLRGITGNLAPQKIDACNNHDWYGSTPCPECAREKNDD